MLERYGARLEPDLRQQAQPVRAPEQTFDVLPWGDFTSNVVTGRTTYTVTPRMSVSALHSVLPNVLTSASPKVSTSSPASASRWR